MTTVDDQGQGAHARSGAARGAVTEQHAGEAAAREADTAAAGANPALVGVPTFVIGAVSLGLYLVGFTGSSTALVGMVPILFMCTGIGQLIGTVWAIKTGAGPVAAIFGIFGGFWLSFAVLATALGNDWFGATSTDTAVATGAQETFLLTWLIGIVVLTLASLRLPSVFTLLFVLVDIALLLVLLGTAAGSTGLLFGGGIAVFAFALVGVYLFVDAMGQATGGKAMPMGKPIVS
jgi:succinate-acetate transporter protein